MELLDGLGCWGCGDCGRWLPHVHLPCQFSDALPGSCYCSRATWAVSAVSFEATEPLPPPDLHSLARCPYLPHLKHCPWNRAGLVVSPVGCWRGGAERRRDTSLGVTNGLTGGLSLARRATGFRRSSGCKVLSYLSAIWAAASTLEGSCIRTHWRAAGVRPWM